MTPEQVIRAHLRLAARALTAAHRVAWSYQLHDLAGELDALARQVEAVEESARHEARGTFANFANRADYGCRRDRGRS